MARKKIRIKAGGAGAFDGNPVHGAYDTAAMTQDEAPARILDYFQAINPFSINKGGYHKIIYEL